jgi:hypothetical protein
MYREDYMVTFDIVQGTCTQTQTPFQYLQAKQMNIPVCTSAAQHSGDHQWLGMISSVMQVKLFALVKCYGDLELNRCLNGCASSRPHH